jgi:Secretion system C-terminal sorting domain
MKKNLLVVLGTIALSMSMTAQITVQSTDFTLSTTGKDSAISKLMKRVGLAIPSRGNNQTWDFSSVRDSIPDIYYTGGITRPITTRPSVFSGANLEADRVVVFQNFEIPSKNYYTLNTSGYSLLGDSIIFSRFPLLLLTGSTADSLTFPAASRKSSTPERRFVFPITATSSNTTTSNTTTNFLLKIPAFGFNNTPGYQSRTTTEKDTTVGWGTLKLRNPASGGVLNFNVLLQLKTIIGIDSFYLGGQPAPGALLDAFSLVQGRKDTFSVFNFIGLGFKAAHVAMETNGNQTQVGRTFRGILPSLGLVSPTRETNDYSVATKVFPNPTSEGITFEFDKKTSGDWHILMYDVVGKITGIQKVSAPQGLTTHKVTFDNSTANGLYFYNIVDENSLIRANGQFVKN